MVAGGPELSLHVVHIDPLDVALVGACEEMSLIGRQLEGCHSSHQFALAFDLEVSLVHPCNSPIASTHDYVST